MLATVMAGREETHSSLEVHRGPEIAPRSGSPFPENPVYVRPDSTLEQLSPSYPSRSFRDSEATKVGHYSEAYGERDEPKTNRTICGLTPVTFWVLVALIFILCAGAIGGGVGGSIAVQSNKNAAENPT